MVLKNNIFEFNSDLFLQLIGTAMGSKPAPSYANIFMAKQIDPKIRKLAKEMEGGRDPIDLFKRFLDDIFLVYTGTVQSLHKFMVELNKIHQVLNSQCHIQLPPQ